MTGGHNDAARRRANQPREERFDWRQRHGEYKASRGGDILTLTKISHVSICKLAAER